MKAVFIICTFIMSSIIFVGCSSMSEFDKSMRSGKDALKSSNYDLAIKEFDNALIERPNDKDAKSLYDRASTEKDEANEVETNQTFVQKAPEKEQELYNNIDSLIDDYSKNVDDFIKNIDINYDAIANLELDTRAYLIGSKGLKPQEHNAILLEYSANSINEAYESVIKDRSSEFTQSRVLLYLDLAKEGLEVYKEYVSTGE